ncbi:MAG: copper resistance system multicopper oxidase [Gammaproteobacteria bacterium]|nr:copper resistance system multicopper oxidase [Gammaproteobacteria bacterium]
MTKETNWLTTPATRRRFVLGTSSVLACAALPWPSLVSANEKPVGIPELRGRNFNLDIDYKMVNFTGKNRIATTVNGSLPAPVLRWKQGDKVTLKVTNHLSHDSSIHWHGMILPSNMDGVPGLSFAGIKPGGTYEYQFDVQQSGTYWYHSHSGFQEQTGLYGAIIIDPAEADPVEYDREYVVILSDWTDEDPADVYAKLKKQSHYYNRQERTAADTWNEIKDKGVTQTWRDRKMWNQMRMSDRDISDVTGATYTFLMNGQTPEQGWTGLFNKGEKVRLRFINAAAMTLFDVRIPNVKMTVVAADGQNIEPVTIDDFRIGVAETYDVIVEPEADKAHTIIAQAIDRTGFAYGVLTPDVNMTAELPELDPSPVLTMADMGMDHGAMMDMSSDMDHQMDHSMHMAMATQMGSGKAGYGSDMPVAHKETEFGPHVDMRAEKPMYKLDDPGIGLRDHAEKYGRKVLTYSDIHNLYPTIDSREPDREIQLHLTGNMARYMWSIDGIKYADAEPLVLKYGERVRFTLINDTMMNHPMHLHGMWSELETGEGTRIPRKHTVIVQPGSKISYLVSADARGRWAYHCHLIFHMMSMFREVKVI